MKKKIELIVADGNEAVDEGFYIEYQYCGNRTGNWIRIDAGKVVRANQENWLKSIEDWHSKLCVAAAQKSNFWWLNNASRLTVWVPFDLRPMLYARAILDICRQEQYSRIHLFEMPVEVVQYLKEWEDKGIANYKLICAKKSIRNNLLIVNMARTLLQFVNLLFVWLISIKLVNKKTRNLDLLVYSYPLNEQTILSKGDNFFGHIFDEIDSSQIKLEWLYEHRNFADLSAIKKVIRKDGRDFNFVFGYLTKQNLFAIFIRALNEIYILKLIANKMPLLTIDAITCIGFSENFARQCFAVPPLWEIALQYAFRRYLKYVNPKAIIYPYEEKGGERALIQVCDAENEKIVTIAFAHAVYCHGHLYVRNCRDTERPGPRYIAVTGLATRNWFNSWAENPIESLRLIGTPRYYLSEENFIRRERSSGQTRQILFLCGIGHEISRLVYFATIRPEIFDNTVLRIRKYPYSWQEQQDQDIYRLKKCGINVLVENQDLAKEINWADIVLFTCTSASIEAMLRNKPCVRIVDDVLDTYMLRDRDVHEAVPNCDTPEELSNCLEKIFNLNDIDYKLLINAQRQIAKDIYSEWNHSLWEMVGSSELMPAVIDMGKSKVK